MNLNDLSGGADQRESYILYALIVLLVCINVFVLIRSFLSTDSFK
jgi:hypothetical protein